MSNYDEDDPWVYWTTPTGSAQIRMRKSEADKRDREQRRDRIIVRVLGTLFVLIVIAGSIAFSWAIAGGEVRCIFADDPALCGIVSEIP